MKSLSKVVQHYPASGIRKMFELAAQYEDVISLTVGEPVFDTPAAVKTAAKQALDDNKTHYVTNAGIAPLRRAIAAKYQHQLSFPCTEDHVMVAFGGMEAIFLALVSVLDPGDEILIPDPGYPNYAGQIQLLGGVPVRVPIYEKHHFCLQAEDLEAAITSKTKAMILNSPSNPLGSVIPCEGMKAIAEVVKRHDLFVISDEVYEALVFEGHTHQSLATFDEIRENILIVNSFSKTYAMTGWRIGYVVGDPRIISNMPKLQEGIASCLPEFIQSAAEAALFLPEDVIQPMRNHYQRNRDLVMEELRTLPGFSCHPIAGTFYAFVNIKAFGKSSQDFAEDLVRHARVLTVPGSAFGPMGEGYLRIVFAGAEDTLKEAFRRIRAYITTLKPKV